MPETYKGMKKIYRQKSKIKYRLKLLNKKGKGKK